MRLEPRSEQGFSLIEVIVATGILATGLLALAGSFAIGMRHMASSSPTIIAREKAREAVESVHTARDTGTLAWSRIRNVAQGGAFLGGSQPMTKPGVDGLVGTADDASAGVEELRLPGPDGVLGNADDKRIPLSDFTREIEITDLLRDGTATINPDLRQIRVTIRYKVDGWWKNYTLTTYVSRYA
jgi:prepilin-type N-terminal cleavage/methylation domain-containing protein